MGVHILLKATRGRLGGQEFPLVDRSRQVLGRSSSCYPRLPVEDLTVSRLHCLLEVNTQNVWVEDLGSLNGTYVNGMSIGQRGEDVLQEPQKAPRILQDGDTLTVGGNCFMVFIEEEPGDDLEFVDAKQEAALV